MADTADRYTHGHHTSVVTQHARRTATVDAHYLLPFLRPGLRLLDAGCGPGSITTGLARLVAPAEAIGIDVSETVLDQAREHAASEGTPNARFEVGDIYHLGYADDSFDVVHAHQLLQHLTRPIEALREMRRILKPGGVGAVRDADYATMTFYPVLPELTRWLQVYHAVAERNGAEADAGRRLPAWVRAAGFHDLRVSGTAVVLGAREQVENWGHSWADRITMSSVADHAVEYAIASRVELEAIAAGWRRWAADPDAFFCYTNVEVIGRA